jgi:hypothetical protein
VDDKQLGKSYHDFSVLVCDGSSQADQEDVPESTYQATFDTSSEVDWTTVRLPWHNFVPVKRAQSDPSGEQALSGLFCIACKFHSCHDCLPNFVYDEGIHVGALPVTKEFMSGHFQ